MAFNCPYCGHTAHSTAMYMTCEESALCQQCGLSESDAWLRNQEDELVARFSAYSLTPQVEQVPESKSVANRIVYASAAAHSFVVSPYNRNGHLNVPGKLDEATWVAKTSPRASDSFDVEMDSEPELSDTTTVDSKRSSFNVDKSSPSNPIDELDHEISQAEPYMSLGYQHDQDTTVHHLQDQHLAQPEEPSTGSPYTPCKDPVYNARNWWDYGGGRLEYRWDCMRDHGM
ncbi:hypothetical protein TSTA_035830 [Talaromyces stipitatus ATCC 10500]|uniref:Uncharacterized protein n=1 Tax=Talaromyces stipitatus (strain ATCC 10500 / CBS 375.48 / QM 6759 / NRRL 1006) TaxID=441959 RepID=B8M7D6_TALSN|nr:uncharacterized protein TSTA_035830 [Talaromyces stipitatus ATCC 10500]EED20356.1 hypothetical protein TSTA_035830 [Talaromyces stipitatus ATCC 10500]